MPRVRRVEIYHFRGVEHLEWVLPADRQFVALIGPGDAGKTTILTALQRALSDSWSVTFSDTDFHVRSPGAVPDGAPMACRRGRRASRS